MKIFKFKIFSNSNENEIHEIEQSNRINFEFYKIFK